jgi:hypothetical protein
MGVIVAKLHVPWRSGLPSGVLSAAELTGFEGPCDVMIVVEIARAKPDVTQNAVQKRRRLIETPLLKVIFVA